MEANEMDDQAYDPSEDFSNPDCSTCGGKCCVGDIEVMPNEPLYGNEALTEPISDKKYDRVMRVAIDGTCACLVNGQCTIYESRPNVCRRFQMGSTCCRAFAYGKRTVHACEECVLHSLSVETAVDIASSAAESVSAGFDDAGVELPVESKVALEGILMAFVSKFIGQRSCQ